jgi:hypothetical protein
MPPFHECAQRAGDVLWVPPGGWFHQTINLEATVSVTHNTVEVGYANGFLRGICFEEFKGGVKVAEEGSNGSNIGYSSAPAAANDVSVTTWDSMYICAALSRLHPSIYRSSCCAAVAYTDHLDKFISPSPPLRTSEIYDELLYRVVGMEVRRTRNPRSQFEPASPP